MKHTGVEEIYKACLATVAPGENRLMRVSLGRKNYTPKEEIVGIVRQILSGGRMSKQQFADAAGVSLPCASNWLHRAHKERVVKSATIRNDRGYGVAYFSLRATP